MTAAAAADGVVSADYAPAGRHPHFALIARRRRLAAPLDISDAWTAVGGPAWCRACPSGGRQTRAASERVEGAPAQFIFHAVLRSKSEFRASYCVNRHVSAVQRTPERTGGNRATCSVVAFRRSTTPLASVFKRTVLNRVVRRSVQANRPYLHCARGRMRRPCASSWRAKLTKSSVSSESGLFILEQTTRCKVSALRLQCSM